MADTPGGFWSRQLGAYLSGKVQQAPSFLHPEVAQMVQEVSQQAMPAPVQPTPTPAPTPAPAAQAPKEPRIRLTGAQRNEIKYFNKENPGFEEYLKGFRPENQTLDAARQPALMDYLSRNPIPEVRQAAQNAFNPTLSLESPATVGLRTAQLGSPETMAYANRVALAGTTAGPQPAAPIQIEPLSQMKARDNVSALRDFQLKTDPRTMAAADRYPLAGTTAGTATAPEPAVDVAGRMNKGYVPKGFWEGATERVFQPEPGPPQGINLNDRDFRAARGLAGILSGMRSGRGLSIAGGIGTLAGIGKEIWDERNARLAEQARSYTLDTPRNGLNQRLIADDMARRTGPEAPFALDRQPPITFPQVLAADGAVGQPQATGRVTTTVGRPGGVASTQQPAAPNQQRGELDLSDMSFKEAFKTARDKAEQLGVEPTGRFMWRGDAYQTNVGPARGRERYVPESQQTRLGNLPQLADAIAPTPQPAPAGERITEVLPRSAPVTPAAPAPAGMPQDVRENQIRIGQQTYPLSFFQENRGALAQLLGAQATQSRQNVEPIEVVPAQRGVVTSYDDIRQRRTQQLLRNPEKGHFSDNPNYQLAWQTLWSPAVRAQFGVTDEQMNELKNKMRESTELKESTTSGSKMTVNKLGVFVLPSTSSTRSSESSSSRESETGSRTQTKKDYSAWVKELNDLIEKDANWARDAEKAEREAIKESAAPAWRDQMKVLDSRIVEVDRRLADSKTSPADKKNLNDLRTRLTDQYERLKEQKP